MKVVIAEVSKVIHVWHPCSDIQMLKIIHTTRKSLNLVLRNLGDTLNHADYASLSRRIQREHATKVSELIKLHRDQAASFFAGTVL